jgi:2-keto-4-pentenoate hydratase/2-oxohepta-3-ene-1,7-dioic acid hydratase in catechol pathway
MRRRQGVAPPEQPLLFAKFPSAACGPHSPIVKLTETQQLDYEVELGVVIGRRVGNVTEDDAMTAVAGYLTLNDVSARDAQFADGQWVRGKSFDTFSPMGPTLVTRDEIADPHDLDVATWVNGQQRQDSNTRNLIFRIEELITYCSRYFTL